MKSSGEEFPKYHFVFQLRGLLKNLSRKFKTNVVRCFDDTTILLIYIQTMKKQSGVSMVPSMIEMLDSISFSLPVYQ